MRPSELSGAEFIARFGGVYEASPWVAEAIWPLAKSGVLDSPEPLGREMRTVVDGASVEMRLALIRAHPQLASRARMADASVKEQAGAGLDQCSPEQFEAFQRLNAAYDARFGFPFIIAVKGLSRAEILAAFEARLANEPEAEFEGAIVQIHRIAAFRIADIFEDRAAV
ncbi:2-oxo-4-hydroxy-4-carboxy-5-ureidoimidazoline decarboxylase [Phenylobacterium hankyongense]|uniref:2-oxo-4-hydroxy-4-carboxy-5-ureidoimidazoline decarboxylase n=1 Tax=Phenylobacterium hankyongense TaxID=1813876 RepID=A0A328B4A6_9CAUL|nr:2-oxo-4-hydroxy-4-carboxy-5-ureidoimidazoline decarboxylase [Phenylobacterium hankyongense]RAK60684.1 2-oxo-4-hydroxy-4-carboxy-5-ureidoimidazoline decarboxylase [Phenylobacterium hankyongense]